jgi:rSAM/selenodomain-associated transferase 1
MTRRIAVFARWPEPGRVKTRLTPALPPSLACDLHRALVEETLATVRATGADERWLFWADAPVDRPAVDGVRIVEQQGADLGERLAHAFTHLLPATGDRAVIVGTDCAALTSGDLTAACAAQSDKDVVLGPTSDGGYYLVGLARPMPELFDGIPWSTSDVFARTLARATEAHARVKSLRTLDDLDTPADLARAIADWLLRSPGDRPPVTARALAAMGLLPAR